MPEAPLTRWRLAFIVNMVCRPLTLFATGDCYRGCTGLPSEGPECRKLRGCQGTDMIGLRTRAADHGGHRSSARPGDRPAHPGGLCFGSARISSCRRPSARLAYSDASLEVLPVDRRRPGALSASRRWCLRGSSSLPRSRPNDRVLDIGCMTGYSTRNPFPSCAGGDSALEAEPELPPQRAPDFRGARDRCAAVAEGRARRAGARGARPLRRDPAERQRARSPGGNSSSNCRRAAGSSASSPTREPGRARQGKAFRFVKVDGEASGVPHFDANAKPLPGFALCPAFTF